MYHMARDKLKKIYNKKEYPIFKILESKVPMQNKLLLDKILSSFIKFKYKSSLRV